jgi:integrase
MGVGCAIRKMFNLAIRWEMRTDNPAAGFIRNPENPRERFLDIAEIERLSQVMNEHKNQRMADVIRLLMLTGARPGEVLNATWDQFDLDRAVWTKPAATTKQRKLHRTPISGAAVQLLRTIRTHSPKNCPWVFPGDANGKPVQEIKRFWDDVLDLVQPAPAPSWLFPHRPHRRSHKERHHERLAPSPAIGSSGAFGFWLKVLD